MMVHASWTLHVPYCLCYVSMFYVMTYNSKLCMHGSYEDCYAIYVQCHVQKEKEKRGVNVML